MARSISALIFLFFVIINVNTLAQNKSDTAAASLEQLLKAHRYPLELEEGKLKDRGERWLREKAKEATVVTLGETHTSQELPALMSALIKHLQQADEFDHLAIEVSPWTTRHMTDRITKGKETYNQFIKKYPFAIPFYNFKKERDLIYQVVQNSDKEHPLWGLDQIFVFSVNLALDRLEELAPSASSQSAIQKIREAGSSKVADNTRLKKLPEGMPAPITAYNPVTFDTLRKHFEGIEEAQEILNELTKSIEIYCLNDTDNYISNQLRARYMRSKLRNAVDRTRKQSKNAPQIVIKVGAFHAYRGLTPNNALDVGNLAISLARSMGGEAFNVAILCGPGSKKISFPAETTDCWPGMLGEDLKTLSKDHPVLFKLKELHPKLHTMNLKLEVPIKEFIWSFDALVIIPNAKAAEAIAYPVK